MNTSDDMQGLLHDVFGRYNDDYPMGDPQEVTDEGHNTESDRFFKLIEDSQQELYPTCKTFSKLSFLIRMLHIKCLDNWTNKSFNMMIGLLREAFPEGVQLPKSWYDAKKILKELGMNYEKYDPCQNDCMLFWGPDDWRTECKTCHQPRWISKTEASLMRWHAEGRSKDGNMRHPADSPAWHTFDYHNAKFANDPRNVRLGNDIGVYLQPLIAELKEIWDVGFKTYDIASKQNFQMRAVLLWTISNLPTNADLSGHATNGYYACPLCHKLASSMRLHFSKKECYMDHRRFLPNNHPYRMDSSSFDGTEEVEDMQLVESDAIYTDLKLLARGPIMVGKKFSGFLVNGFRFHTKDQESNKKTQNSGIMVSTITSSFANRRDNRPIVTELSYYGAIRDMIELDYLQERKVVLFDCEWVSKGKRLKQDDDGFTLTNFKNFKRHNEPFILASQAKQVFYVEDPIESNWKVVLKTVARDYYDMQERNELDMDQWGTVRPPHKNEEVVLVRDDVVGTKQEEVLVHHQESPRSDGCLSDHTNKNKIRGSTFCPKIWGLPSGVKLSVQLNKFGQPIDDNSSQFSTFLGTLAKMGTYCPIDILDWRKVPKSNKNEMLGIVQSRFLGILGMDEWILQSIGKKWRHWKKDLKLKYFEPEMPLEYLLKITDERVIEEQWKGLLTFWLSEEGKVNCSVSLLSIMDRKEIVTKGFLKNMDPSKQVGGQV
ncbi:hypothetical protein BUALT_Bualt17G0001300 [Buddleja alternifolia]|uniref:DUF4216 domain-containing protein n=1 Tax=Buddleja alternifolia TaxID=168488 RepID=A0AAV6WAJ5_9LAMI|nr:hypothetical protein BUALT_Bualt17G0001300 [Buddleja alternifolia]